MANETCPHCGTEHDDNVETVSPWRLHNLARCRDVLHAQLQHAQARERELSEILDADRHETLVHAAAFMKAQRDEARAELSRRASSSRQFLEAAMRIIEGGKS